MLRIVVVWVHLLSVAAVFGGVLVLHGYLRRGGVVTEALQTVARRLNMLVGVVMLTGGVAAIVKIMSLLEAELPLGHAVGVMAIKLVLLGAVGAFLGIDASKLREGGSGSGVLRLASLAAIAVAAFLGVTLAV